MTTMRSYGDGCGIAQALDVIGERWALLVVRELLLGPKRFVDLEKGLPNASANVLSQRLRELERGGVVKRTRLPPPAGSRVYELTDWGKQLEDVAIGLGRWAARSPAPPPQSPIGVDSIMLGIKARFDPGVTRGVHASYDLQLGDSRFGVRLDSGELVVTRGGITDPDALIATDPETLRAVLWHGRSLTDAQRSGDMIVQGSTAAVARLVRLFAPPPRIV